MQVLRDCVSKFFPSADGPMTKAAACMFTNSTDRHFILDQHPQHPQASMASGSAQSSSPLLGWVGVPTGCSSACRGLCASHSWPGLAGLSLMRLLILCSMAFGIIWGARVQ